MRNIFLIAFALIFIGAFTVHSEELNKDSTRVYQIPSLTVTTSRAQERESPVPFSEITVSEIAQRHTVNDLPKILSETPSILAFSESGNFIGYTNLTLRGFDQRRISIVINGIPQNDPEDHNFYWINMTDLAAGLESIQIQRGAGLANYGPAAIGGSIIMTTKNFARERSIEFSTGIGFQESASSLYDAGQYGSKFGLSASSGIIDNKYAFYTRINRINSFGYRDQSWATLNSYQFGVARFDENLTTQINFITGSQDDGLAYTGLPKAYVKDADKRRANYNYWSYDRNNGTEVNWVTVRRKQEVEQFSQPQVELLNDWHISENLELKSALFFKTGQGYFDYDGTGWTDATSFRLNEQNGYPDTIDPQNPIIRAFVGNKYGGWIPRIVYNHGNGIFTSGMEIRSHRSSHWGKINFAENLPENFDPDFKFYSYNGIRDIFSVFANEKLFLNERIALNLEAQLVYQSYGIENERAGNVFTEYTTKDGNTVGNGERLFDVNYVFFNPRIGINFNLTDEMNTYISIAHTSREPRMKNLYAASDAFDGATPLFSYDTVGGVRRYDFSKALVKPEKMLNLELGWGYLTTDFSVNAGFYWMEYADELVKSGQTDLFGSPIDGNAPKTRHYGIELQATKIFAVSDLFDLTISGNATYSQNKIIEYNFPTRQGHLISLADNNIAGFPDFMANLRVGISNKDLYFGLALKHVGTYKTDNFGDILTTDERIKSHLGGGYYADNNFDAYTVFDASLIYTFRQLPFLEELKIHAVANNLTNLYYASGAIGREFFPAAERNYWVNFVFGL